jgi:hypothetical protein
LDLSQAIDDFAADDEVTRKVGVGSLVSAVPLVNIAALGYEIRVARRVAGGHDRPLPAWDEPGALFVEGLGLAVARWVYMLPMLGALVGSLLLSLPLLSRMSANEAAGEPVGALAAVLFAGCSLVVVFLLSYGLLYGFLSPAIVAQYARYGTFAACFDFAAMGRFIRRNPAGYVRSWLTLLALGLVAGLAGSVAGTLLRVLPCLGTLLNMGVFGWSMFMVLLIQGHLTGQLLRVDQAKLV